MTTPQFTAKAALLAAIFASAGLILSTISLGLTIYRHSHEDSIDQATSQAVSQAVNQVTNQVTVTNVEASCTQAVRISVEGTGFYFSFPLRMGYSWSDKLPDGTAFKVSLSKE